MTKHKRHLHCITWWAACQCGGSYAEHWPGNHLYSTLRLLRECMMQHNDEFYSTLHGSVY